MNSALSVYADTVCFGAIYRQYTFGQKYARYMYMIFTYRQLRLRSVGEYSPHLDQTPISTKTNAA